MENQDERAGIGGYAAPRQQRKQNGQRAHIENQDAVDDLVGGLRNALLRVIRFGCGDTDQLQPAEREHNNRHHHYQPGEAVRQESALLPQVAYGGLRAAVAAEQQPAAEQDHRHDGDDFDDREPELHLAKHLDVRQVDGVDSDKENGRRNPGRNFRPPELDVFPDRGQLGHRDQHVKHPVVPAGSEACKAAPVFVGKMTK